MASDDVPLGTPPFHVGAVLSQSFRTLFRNLASFGLLALSLILVQAGLQWVATGGNYFRAIGDWVSEDGVVVYGPALAIQLVVSWLITAALVYGTVQDLRGRRPGLAECVGRGVTMVLPVVGVILVSWLLIAAGIMLLVVPGVVLYLLFWVAVPVAVVERPGIIASLKRSAELTRGNRWRILGLVLILNVIQFLLQRFLVMPVALVADFADTSGALSTAAELLLTAFGVALWAVAAAVGYYHLRVAREGAHIEQIAAVFE